MKEVNDQVKKINTPTVVDMDYAPTYDKSDDEAGNEQPDTTNMSDLEGEESADERKKQEAKGLKILTPELMLSRLPISLAQLKAGNTSEKLKNEIRQLFSSLYRSKKLSKTIYKHLMNVII